ncbi:MAG: glycine oxidase ThiO [Actinomycetota bacterium]|jgi:glycine oxidase
MAEDCEASTRSADALIVGGGVIGLSVAWRLAQRGLTVTVVDDDPAGGASRAAAGMLAPITEAHFGEEALTALNLESARRWPAFAAEVEAATGAAVGYRTEGTLAVAFDDDDLAVLTELRAYHERLGLPGQRLRGRECRALEPLLSPLVRGGIFVESDHQVETRALTAALLVAAERSGVTLVRRRAARLDLDGNGERRAVGVTLDSGEQLRAPVTVLAAGCWSATLPGLPAAVRPPVRPVKGQILRLRPADRHAPRLSCTVRGLRRGRSIYAVPRADGRVVVGATCEEKGWDTTVTAGAVRELLEDATEVVPALGEFELAETLARLRPGTPDNGPILGPSALPGLLLATGHYRNGVLLAPLTADAVADAVVGGTMPAVAEPFAAHRFVGALT